MGEALAHTYLEKGDLVYAIGRTFPKIFESYANFHFFPFDLSQVRLLRYKVGPFVENNTFDLVILNAGILGEIKVLSQTDIMEIQKVMDINVWANKELLDLLSEKAEVKQVVGISSGAAVNGSKGWGAYSLSKSALNMLLKVYAKETPHIHFTALAPGVIATPMVAYIINNVDTKTYPSVRRLKEGVIQTPKEAADNLISLFPKLLEYENGAFLDIRTMT